MKEHFSFTFPHQDVQEDFFREIESIGKSVFSNIIFDNRVFTISYIEAKSIINQNGSYRNVLKQINNIEAMIVPDSYDASNFHSSMLAIIKDSKGSFLALFNRLKKFILNFSVSQNKFNVVWYTTYRNIATGGNQK